jgi:hypothetical protein
MHTHAYTYVHVYTHTDTYIRIHTILASGAQARRRGVGHGVGHPTLLRTRAHTYTKISSGSTGYLGTHIISSYLHLAREAQRMKGPARGSSSSHTGVVGRRAAVGALSLST